MSHPKKVSVELKKKGWKVRGKTPDVFEVAAKMFVAGLVKKRKK